jgi:FG-GAP-like repeat/FG-GAP repeat
MKRMISLAILLIGAVALAAQRSTPPGDLTLPVGGGSVVVGDLNRDGRPDIVTARDHAVTVYLGDSRGRFEQATGSPFAAGDNPSDLALGDFDEDGRLDVVIANHETTYITLLSGDGKGGLGPPVRIPVPSRPHPHGVAVGDFNGDRHLDVAVESWAENAVLILRGNGRAAFSEPERLTVGRKPYYRLRAGDVNNDGKADLVTTNEDSGSVSVLCSNRTSALQAAMETSIARSPFAVAIGDVNGDRHPDLTVAHRYGSVDPKFDRLTILTGSGDCGFVPRSESLPVGSSPTAVAIGDFDGDKIGDVGVANMGSNDVTVVLGSRSGWRPAKGSPFSVGKGPMAVALHDLNGDGKADIVTGNSGSADVSVVISQ